MNIFHFRILDIVGGKKIAQNVTLLKLEGRLVQIAFLEGSKVTEFDFMPIMLHRLTLTGSTLRARSIEEKAASAR